MIGAAAITNPKSVLFIAAFLRQFLDPHGSLFLQFIIVASTFAAIEIATEFFIASMANRISLWLRSVGRRFSQVCGGVLMAIGGRCRCGTESTLGTPPRDAKVSHAIQ